MADPLREKLQALFGELHQQAALYRRGQELSNESQALAYTQCARKIAALLAESEQRCPHGASDGMCPVLGCGNYPGEPVLKLGHKYEPCELNPDCPGCHNNGCSLPREAH